MSLKGDKYETVDEVRARLENSVVLYDGDPVYITRCQLPEDREEKGEIARVYFFPLPLYKGLKKGGEKEVRKYLSSRKFDITPLKLGYFNHDNRATFVARSPVRQYKQGMCHGIVTFATPTNKRDDNMTFNTMLESQGFVDMVAGKFPDFKDAGAMLGNEDHSSVAVSRSFAFIIDNDLDALCLVHKGTKCGIAMNGDRAIKVSNKFHFLREEMEDCRIPIA